MSQTVTMRLPETTAEWLKTTARQSGRSVSEWGANLFEEARRVSQFAAIEFRTFSGQRQACLTGGLRLWKIIYSAQGYGMDAEKTAAHFELPAWRIQGALHYYEAFPEEINDAIASVRSQDFQTLKRKLPALELHEVTVNEVSVDEVSVDEVAEEAMA